VRFDLIIYKWSIRSFLFYFSLKIIYYRFYEFCNCNVSLFLAPYILYIYLFIFCAIYIYIPDYLCVSLHLSMRFQTYFRAIHDPITCRDLFSLPQVSSPILIWTSTSTVTRTTPAILLWPRWRLRRFGYWRTIPRVSSSSWRVSQKLRHQRERATYNFVRGGERSNSREIHLQRESVWNITLRNESCCLYTRWNTHSCVLKWNLHFF